MKKPITLLTCLCISLAFLVTAANAKVSEQTAEAFGRIATQNAGRTKPLDTLARSYLLAFYHKSTIHGRSASAWLVDTMFEPHTAYNEPIFRIRNDDVVAALNVNISPKHLYSFNDLREGFQVIFKDLKIYYAKERYLRTLVENQLVELYINTQRYYQLSRSVSCLLPDFVINDAELAAQLQVTAGEHVSFLHLSKYRQVIASMVEKLNKTKSESSLKHKAMYQLVVQLNARLKDQSSTDLLLIAPAVGEKWDAPWALLDGRPLADSQKESLALLEKVVAAVTTNNPMAVTQAVNTLKNKMPSKASINIEMFYNKTDLFYRSLYGYIAGFIFLVLSLLIGHRWNRRISIACVTFGLVAHGVGLGLRMIIMGRPPVSNLYESIIFVGFIAVFFGMLIELWRKDNLGLLIATIIGASMHFIGFSYASEGDTMGMLVAVLDSNFWLATHVVTITIGYGTALVASLVGHLLLAKLIWQSKKTKQVSSLLFTARITTIVALFFTTLGTILGGIWADQSWGRFWGWDPKENGAMLIVIWLLFVIHGHIAGRLKKIAFAGLLSLTSITVILAWFGVNLLNVGLHSYGFTENIAKTIAIFCGSEVLLITVGCTMAWRANKKNKKAAGLTTVG